MAGRSLNKAMIIGNLGADPEVKYLPSGRAVANLRVATNRQWQDKDSGEQKEQTEWHRVTLFGGMAEVAGKYLSRGSRVFIEGRLQTREWEKDGQKRYTTEIIAENMIMLGGKGESADQDTGYDKDYSAPSQDEDIPF